jgi:hypothetical protein
MLSTVLLIVLILLLIGAVPSWPYSRGWGYGPSGILGVVLVIVLVLALTGRVYPRLNSAWVRRSTRADLRVPSQRAVG